MASRQSAIEFACVSFHDHTLTQQKVEAKVTQTSAHVCKRKGTRPQLHQSVFIIFIWAKSERCGLCVITAVIIRVVGALC